LSSITRASGVLTNSIQSDANAADGSNIAMRIIIRIFSGSTCGTWLQFTVYFYGWLICAEVPGARIYVRVHTRKDWDPATL
jgi:hypothetical protein